jgi:hypothetical protein
VALLHCEGTPCRCRTPCKENSLLSQASAAYLGQHFAAAAGGAGVGAGPLHVVYDYVPGAGDEEESWAHGLTPELMWRHRRELLAAGLDGIQAAVARLLSGQQQGQQGQQGLPQELQTAAAAQQQGEQQGEQQQQQQQQQQAAGAPPAPIAIKPKWVTARPLPAGEGQHCLRPLGCRQAGPAAAPASAAVAAGVSVSGRGSGGGSGSGSSAATNGSSAGAAVGPALTAATGAGAGAPAGMHFLGDTGLAVGAAAVGAAPAVWGFVDAVLNVGLREHPGMAQERAQPQAAAAHAATAAAVPGQALPPTAALAVPAAAAVAAGEGREPCLREASGAGQAELPPGAAPVACAQQGPSMAAAGLGLAGPSPPTAAAAERSAGGVSSHAVVAAAAEGTGAPSPDSQPAPLPRYLWLPVPHSKFERQGLRAALPEALSFVSGHLQAGRRVLIHCDDGRWVGTWARLGAVAQGLGCSWGSFLGPGSCTCARPVYHSGCMHDTC